MFRYLESTSFTRALLSVVIAKRHQLLIAKKTTEKRSHTLLSRITSEKIQSKVPIKFIVTIGYRYAIQVNVKVRTKIKESGSYENNFSE